MKKFLAVSCSLMLGAMLAFSLVGCGGTEEVPDKDVGNTDPGNTPGGEQTVVEIPTPAQVVSAIHSASAAEVQNYDFTLNLAGSVSIGIVQSPNANANYDCSYRYNTETGELAFKRTTSGILLYDATEYIYSSGDTRISVKMNEKGEVKKAVVGDRNTELKLINLPFTTLIDSLTAEEIAGIKQVSPDNYTANLTLSSDNVALNAICGMLGKIDASIDLKGVTVTNPVNGIDFLFTMSNGTFTGYTFKAAVSIPVKSASAELALTYTQKASSSPIALPSTAGIVTDSTQIAAELATINSALNGIKDGDAYSLDFEAVNEMDPAWNVLATKDSYKARLYKNTDKAGDISFNHSFEYHSHHETDGREPYKFTIGNTTDDGKTYLLSRKGSNTTTPLENVTADTQFEYLTKHFLRSASDIDCLKKVTEQSTTTYTFYLNDGIAAQTSKDIVAFLNTNEAEGVVDVENYFNDSAYTVEDASLTVVMNGNTVVSMKLDTEIKYNPTAGDYTENNITLNNELTLSVNQNLKKAQDYGAPKKPDGLLSHLEYIL